MRNGIFAIIDIGSSAFRMQINEFVDGESRTLEYLTKSLSLGKETFNKGYISLETVKKSTEIINKFLKKARDYHISKVVAVATSGLREAINRDFFIDYIKKNTGLSINILELYEELFIRYTAFVNEVEDVNELEKNGVIFANVSSGNVALTINCKKCIIYAEALPFGSLRLNEIFKDLDDREKIKAFKKYVQNMLSEFKKILDKKQPKLIFFTGSTVTILRSIFNPKKEEIYLSDIKKLLSDVKYLNSENIAKKYNLQHNKAEILKAVLVSYIEIMELSKQKKFHFSKTKFPHKLLHYYFKGYRKTSLKRYLENTLIYQGEKYDFDKNHALAVQKHTRNLFKGLREIHNLSNKYLTLLEIAAITHDIGYFINPNNHEFNSYYILKSMHIPGIFEKDMNIVALTALMHREKDVEDYKAYFDNINPEDVFLLKKMVAILRVADALDAGHNQVIHSFDIVKISDTIFLDLHVSGYTFLEEISLARKSKLFENVFGVKIEIGKKLAN